MAHQVYHASAMSKRTTGSSFPLSLVSDEQDVAVAAVAAVANSEATSQGDVSWKKLFSFTRWPHVYTLIAAVLSAAVVAGVKTVLAVMLGKIFDVIADFGSGSKSPASTISDISKLCLILLALGITNWLASTAFLASWILFGELQASSVRQEVFGSLLPRSISWFDSVDHGMSSLIVQIQSQTRELQSATSQVLGLLVSDLVTSIASLAVALYYAWKLTLVLLATLPISAIILSLANRRLQPSIQAQKRDLSVASQHVAASIAAISLVKAFDGTDQELRKYRSDIQRAARQYLVQAQCNSIQMGYVSFWVISMFLVGVAYGIVLVNEGLTPGNVLTTFYATLATLQSIEALMPQWLVLAKGMSAGTFLCALASRPPGSDTTSGIIGSNRPDYCEGTVELTDVSFAYPSNPTRKVLSKSSFLFPAGESTFVVGRSGSGKSTLGNLIANFYSPETGDVRIDGQSLKQLDKSWVQSRITLIQQASVLFTDTFFKNIALGHIHPEEASREEILHACDFALLQSTLASLPQGLSTWLGIGGCSLSGGQTQRLALARAWLRDSPVLILDEVTSGLDRVSRALIMDAIRAWRHGKTTIIITHDISQVGDDDYAYVMDSSELVEKGTKRDLLNIGDGLFAALAAFIPDDAAYLQSVSSPERSGDYVTVLPFMRTATSPSIKPLDLEASTVDEVNHIVKVKDDNISATGETQSHPIDSTDHMQAELRRFSAFVDWRLSASDSIGLISRDSDNVSPSLPTVEMHSTCSDDEENPGYQPPFVFGGADRRGPEWGAASRSLVSKATEATKGLSQSEQDGKEGSIAQTLQTVWPALKTRDRVKLALGLAACLMVAVVTPAFSYCFAQLLRAMWLPTGKLAAVQRWAPILVTIAVLDGLSTTVARYTLESVAQSWVNTIRVEALKRIFGQSMLWFDDKAHAPGRINECLDRNAEEMRNILGRFVPIITVAVVMMLVSVTWAMAVSWKLTLVALAPLPAFLGAVKGYAIASSIWEGRCNKGAEDASAAVTEIFLNIRVVRALSLEKYFSKIYQKLAADTFELGMQRAVWTSWLYGLYQSLNYGVTALVFYYGTVMLAKEGSITATEVLEVVNLLLFGMGSAVGMLSGVPQLTMAQATAVQLLRYANLPLEPEEERRGMKKVSNPLPVRMNDLEFAYRAQSKGKTLLGVSLEIESRQCTAIVGRSGCGKSTIVSLLLGLYVPSRPSDPEAGAPLTFGGVSYADVNVQHLRSMMGYVPQEPFLFPASISENIAFGLREDSPHRQYQSIVRASRAAGLHDFISSLPQGYDTRVGEGGQALSGGQAQRLCIARALVREPLLLILDEPTSALDADSASIIRQTIRDLIQGQGAGGGEMAIVLITHNKDMMRAADKIIVLEDGSKAEEGTYRQLMALRGVFAELIGSGEWTRDGSDMSTTISK